MALLPNSSLSLRAEQLGSPDLTAERTTPAASHRKRRDFVFVVNPKGRVGSLIVGANGRTGKEWNKLLPYLRTRLADHCNVCESVTLGPSHAINITREAIREGAEAVIAVGGDGTLHEVVNGFFWDGNPLVSTTSLGLIPLGTGSDFARTFGWKNDPYDAVERIAKGNKSKLDVGSIEGPTGDKHFFVNVADIHLSAKAGYFSSQYKKFGNLCYIIGALKAFNGHENHDMAIKVDGGEWESVTKVTAMCIGNAKYFGGGMKITPTADPTNGHLELVILQSFKWYDFLINLHRLYGGTHLSVKGVSSRSVKSIEVKEKVPCGDIYVQSDGEHWGFLSTKISLLPGAIDFLC